MEIYNLVHSICCPHSSFHFVSLIDPHIKAFRKPGFPFPQLHCFDDFCGVCYLLKIVISKCLNLTEVTCDQPMNSAGRSAHTAGKIKKHISHCVLEGIFAHPSLSLSLMPGSEYLLLCHQTIHIMISLLCHRLLLSNSMHFKQDQIMNISEESWPGCYFKKERQRQSSSYLPSSRVFANFTSLSAPWNSLKKGRALIS